MFQDCTALEKAPRLWAEFWEDNCCEGMFLNCTKLSSVTLFIESDRNDYSNPHFYLSNWLNGAGTDTAQLNLVGVMYAFYNDHRDDWTNESLFPANWTVQSL